MSAPGSAASRSLAGLLVGELLVYQSLWATERRIPGTPELSVEERFDRAKAAGFDGMAIDFGAMSLEAARAAAPNYARSGLRSLVIAFPRTIEDLRPALRFAKEIDSPFVIVVGQVMPIRVAEMIEVIEAWLAIADEEKVSIQFETHRNCITNDLFATLQLLEAIPSMRLSADLSHYVVDREMPCPPSSELQGMVSDVLARADSFQGRVAARGQIQLPLAFPQNRKWLELFLGWWEEGLRSFASRSGPEAEAVFLCELGPPEYALTGADGRELSDREAESLVLARHARAIWQRVRASAAQPA
ncbi:MAG: sugar phosphate isomerase/epimerase [Hyphomicrobiales bacterium]|nr:sugar phosphate isomerase/epimerase [Hyphomicrobiales bacterium]